MSIVEDTALAELDLTSVKRKLMQGKSGKDWPQERVEAAEREYRRFLYLMKKFPNEVIAPSVQVDSFWHQHILDTTKYARDCAAVFGYFLHHNPYLGIGGEGDVALRLRAGKRMRELYDDTFGAPDSGGASTLCATLAHSAAFSAAAQASETAFCAAAADDATAFFAGTDPAQTSHKGAAQLHPELVT